LPLIGRSSVRLLRRMTPEEAEGFRRGRPHHHAVIGEYDCRSMRRSIPVVLFVVLALVPLIRVASTFRVFSQTIDEPAHISAGMEWLVQGTYNLDPEHPPLGRVMFGLWPYLEGARDIDANVLLARHDRYRHNLTISRAGNLLFLAKFSFLLFFPTGAIALAAARRSLPRLPRLMVTIPLAALIVWGGYRFSVGTIKEAYSHVVGNEQAQAAAKRYA